MYEVSWSAEAEADFKALSVFVRGPIIKAIVPLRHQVEVETRNRKRLAAPLDGLREAEWSVRIGEFRVLYVVEDRAVRVLRIILKGTGTMQEARARSVHR